jgi:hypothetical protein
MLLVGTLVACGLVVATSLTPPSAAVAAPAPGNPFASLSPSEAQVGTTTRIDVGFTRYNREIIAGEWTIYAPPGVIELEPTAGNTAGCRAAADGATFHCPAGTFSPNERKTASIGFRVTSAGTFDISTAISYKMNASPATTFAEPLGRLALTGVPTDGLPTNSCKAVYFVGSRGSGENIKTPTADTHSPVYGMGNRVSFLYEKWLATVPAGVSVGTIYNSYTATGVEFLYPTKSELVAFTFGGGLGAAWAMGDYYYGNKDRGAASFMASVKLGSDVLETQLTNKNRECPDAKFVLAGYSQGAMAVHQVELGLRNTPIARKIIATFLIADGDRVANTRANRFGTAGAGATGVRTAINKVLASLQPRPTDVLDPSATADICDKGDIVCDWSLPTLRHASEGGRIHGAYNNQENGGVAQSVHAMETRINAALQAR